MDPKWKPKCVPHGPEIDPKSKPKLVLNGPEIGSKWKPKNYPKWIRNSSGICQKLIRSGSELDEMDPKMSPNWVRIGSKMAPEWARDGPGWDKPSWLVQPGAWLDKPGVNA